MPVSVRVLGHLEQKFLEYSFSWNDSLIGTKVLGTFAPEERMLHRSESSKEGMFHATKVPRERKFSLWTFRSRERKCRGTKRPGFVRISTQSSWFVSEMSVSHQNAPKIIILGTRFFSGEGHIPSSGDVPPHPTTSHPPPSEMLNMPLPIFVRINIYKLYFGLATT